MRFTRKPRNLSRHTAATALGATAVLAVSSLLLAGTTSASFSDVSYGNATVRTESTMTVPAWDTDISTSTGVFLSKFGEVYVTGYRATGDGNGTAPLASTVPTKVTFPAGVKIVDVAGASNDLTGAGQTSFEALDSEGRIYTWGQPWGGPTYIGRGSTLTLAQSWTAGQVTKTAEGTALPKIAAMGRSENQFYALDYDGQMWAWGYGGENLPTPTRGSQYLPTRSNLTTRTPVLANCNGALSETNLGTVKWHSLWAGANSSGAVSTSGLIYNWGYDASTGIAGAPFVNPSCPALNEGANRILFTQYPALYKDATGASFKATGTAAEQTASYRAVVENMRATPLAECNSVMTTAFVDSSACPVRQLGFSASSPRLLLQNGQLYTWKTTGAGDGTAFVGRAGTDTQQRTPTVVSVGGSTTNVDRVSAGVSSVLALTKTGEVYGWGYNNYCQAIGATTGTGGALTGKDCATTGIDSISLAATGVITPTKIAGIPAGSKITSISTAQCSAFAEADNGNIYAWGGGTLKGNVFNYCIGGAAGSEGFKIYNGTKSSDTNPNGAPVTTRTTGTLLIRGYDN